MNWEDEIKFLHSLGLNIFIFRKEEWDYQNMFVVVTRSGGDELFHPETLPKPDLDRLRNWIKCGDPTPGLLSEWRDVDVSGLNIKAYIAGENPGIDCTSVADDMFTKEGGERITYATRRDGKTNKIKKVSHPEDYVDLRCHYLKLWSNARDFSDICILNRKFLLGQTFQTPYHCGPVDEETIPLIPGLLRLHDFGLLTIGSQPYEQTVSRLKEEWEECRQRPFISFIMRGDPISLKFFENLKKRPEIVVHAVEYPFKAIAGSHDEEHPVTQRRAARTVADLGSEEWETYTSVCNIIDMSTEDLFVLDAMKQSNLLDFDVAAREWTYVELTGLIEEVAIKCNLPRTGK